MFRCDVCGRGLNLKETCAGLLAYRGRSYPFVSVNGSRREMRVRWLCERCERRARRYRAAREEALAGGSPPAAAPAEREESR